MGIPVTLVMATTAARVKVERCRGLGAEVVLAGKSFAEATEVAADRSRGMGARLIHPFDDADVIAGQGTLGLELLEQLPGLAAVIVAVGGGGLVAGVATVVKAFDPAIQVIAVEPAQAPSFSAAWRTGRAETVCVRPTLADGLAVARVGERALAVARGRVDAVVTVSEDDIAFAMLRLLETQRAVVEGAGAAALAAVLSGSCPWLAGKRVAVIVSGGNVDSTTFVAALSRGIEERRLTESSPAA